MPAATLSATNKALYDQVIESAYKHAEQVFGSMFQRPLVVWNLRGAGTMGMYHPAQHTIRLHPGYARANHEAYLDTVLHEVAHAIQEVLRLSAVSHNNRDAARCKGDWTAHGRIWKQCARLVGANPVRCGTATAEEVQIAAPSNVMLSCSGCGVRASVGKRRAVSAIQRQATHRGCGSLFEIEGKPTVTLAIRTGRLTKI